MIKINNFHDIYGDGSNLGPAFSWISSSPKQYYLPGSSLAYSYSLFYSGDAVSIWTNLPTECWYGRDLPLDHKTSAQDFLLAQDLWLIFPLLAIWFIATISPLVPLFCNTILQLFHNNFSMNESSSPAELLPREEMNFFIDGSLAMREVLITPTLGGCFNWTKHLTPVKASSWEDGLGIAEIAHMGAQGSEILASIGPLFEFKFTTGHDAKIISKIKKSLIGNGDKSE